MAQVVTTIPQTVLPTAGITLAEVMAFLPQTIPFSGIIGLSGKIVKGKQVGRLVFQLRDDVEPSAELRQYFAALVEGATNGVHTATVNNAWRDLGLDIMWLYVDGQRIITNDLVYTQAVPPVPLPLELTSELVMARLPSAVPFAQTIWMTGGLVKNGFSINDLDFVVGEPAFDGEEVTGFSNVEKPQLMLIKRHFEEVMNIGVTVFDRIRVDIGNRIMSEREPVYLCKMYENGQLVYDNG
jgi:hypothetical protein